MIACPSRFELERFLGLDPLDQSGSPTETHLNECPSCQAAVQSVLLAPRTAPYPGGTPGRNVEPVVAPDGYRLVGPLGRGGVGEVWHAEQEHPRRPVAIKFLHAGAKAGADVRERFRVEAEAAARVRHPNVVQVYGAGVGADGSPYLVMEYLGGGSLRDRMTGEPWAPRRAAALVAALARAVGHAHALGVIHRDLKPGNVLLDPTARPADATPAPADGLGFTPKVADFGLAKVADLDSALTRTGVVMGTPEYMAPEQADGRTKRVGPRTDVYALGVILYELLTGRTPFRGESAVATLDLIRFEEPVPPHRLSPAVPRDLETICLKCLEKDPRHRYRSADELAADLDRFAGGLPVQARPVGLLGRAWRWRRRNPAVAALVAALVVVPLASAAAAGWVAWSMARKAHAEERARQQEEQARKEAEQSAVSAEQDRQLAELSQQAAEERNRAAERLRQVAEERNRAVGEVLLKWSEELRNKPQALAQAEATKRAAEKFWQLGMALRSVERSGAMMFPGGPGTPADPTGNVLPFLLPYMEQNSLFNEAVLPIAGPAVMMDWARSLIPRPPEAKKPAGSKPKGENRPVAQPSPAADPEAFPNLPIFGNPGAGGIPGFPPGLLPTPGGDGGFPLPIPGMFGPPAKPKPKK